MIDKKLSYQNKTKQKQDLYKQDLKHIKYCTMTFSSCCHFLSWYESLISKYVAVKAYNKQSNA